jgi:hypothetical protein
MNQALAADRYPVVVSATAVTVMVVMVLLLAGAPLYTEDMWWHLKAGEMYATEGLWPDADWMLHTAHADAPVQHEWLFGWLLYQLHGLVGFQGLRVFHALMVGIILWVAYTSFRRVSPWAVAACFATCAFALFAWFRLFQLRPDLVSILAALLVYRLLLEGDESPGWMRVAGYVAIIVAWVNFHSLFLLGVNLVIAALMGVVLGMLLERFLVSPHSRDPQRAENNRRRAVQLAGAVVIGLVAALLNPRGIEQHLTFVTSTESTAVWHITDEWSHFNPFVPGANHPTVSLLRWVAADVMLVMFLVAAAAGFLRVLRSRTLAAVDEFQPVRFGLALASVVAMLISIRFMWMSVFPLLYLLHTVNWIGLATGRPARSVAWALALASVALCAWFSVGYGFANLVSRFATDPTEYLSRAYGTHKFHVEGVRLLEESGVEGNLFNAYYMGGFLGYWLTPRLQTFVDSRTEHYDSDVYLDYSAATELLGVRPGESFLDVLDRHDVNVFFGVGFPGWWHVVNTTTHLENMPGWLLVSRSFRHGIYLRDDDRNRANIARIATYYEAESVPFDSRRGLDPSQVIRARPDWAMEHAMLPPEYPDLVSQSQSSNPQGRLEASNALGLVYLLTGAYEAQVARDRQTAGEHPRDKSSRRRLVYGLLRLGEAERAGVVAEELVAIDPDDSWSRELAELVRKYRVYDAEAPSELAAKAMQVHRNSLLWKAFPATTAETWAVEHSMITEDPLP